MAYSFRAHMEGTVDVFYNYIGVYTSGLTFKMGGTKIEYTKIKYYG